MSKAKGVGFRWDTGVFTGPIPTNGVPTVRIATEQARHEIKDDKGAIVGEVYYHPITKIRADIIADQKPLVGQVIAIGGRNYFCNKVSRRMRLKHADGSFAGWGFRVLGSRTEAINGNGACPE